MAIPGSGAISMSMFNTELGRASNTANSSLAGGTTPSVGSQFWLANQSGSLNQTAPHAMSEWYGYSISTTTTTSTTSTTTTAVYTVTVYMKQGITPTPDASAFLYTYSTDPNSPTYRGPISDTICQSFPVSTFTVPAGTTLYFGVITDALGGDNESVYFNAAVSSTCPSNAATYCFGGFSQTINANTNIAITAYVAKFGTYVACGGQCIACN